MSETVSAGSEALRSIIEYRGLNAHALAEMTDGSVSDSTIRNYMKGSPPSKTKLRAIAEALERDGIDLLRAYGQDAMADDLERRLDQGQRDGMFIPTARTERKLTADELDQFRRKVDELQEMLDQIRRGL